MAISYVAEAEWTFAGTATTTINVRIPSGIQEGDLLICGHGNVSSYASGVTMNNSWTKLQEVGIDSTNCYFLLAAKIATATEVGLAGSTQQIATAPNTNGGTNKTTQSVAYRGTYDTVGTAVPSSNVKHESAPADQTIETNSVSTTDSTQWLTFFFNMADSGNATASSWSSAGNTFRGDAEINNSTSTTSSVACYDSNGSVAVQSWQKSGTWSGSATRLNGAIAVVAGPVAISSSDTGSATESQSLSASVSGSDTAVGSESQSLAASLSGSDTASGTETQSIVATFSGSDTGLGSDTGSVAASASSSDTGTGTESHSITASLSGSDTVVGNESESVSASGSTTPSSSDTVSSTESYSIVATLSSSDSGSSSESQNNPGGSSVEVGDYVSTLVMGPATIYVADFGALEPSDEDVATAPSAAVWKDIGGTFEGVLLVVKNTWEEVEVHQISSRATSRLKRRRVLVETSMAEPTLINLLYAVNSGSVTSGAGYESYSPPFLDRATPLTYRAVMIDGWSPGLNGDRHKRRRVILRKCLSVEGTDLAYTADKLTTPSVTWAVHRIDESTPSFKVIDEV